MTTIAYKDRIIAYDSRITRGSHIYNDNYNKKIEKEGLLFFVSGRTCDYEYFIDCIINGVFETNREILVGAFFIKDGELFEAATQEQLIWVERVDLFIHDAIGSGADHAITAMDLGYSAEESVFIAAQRDTHTGGKINKFIME